MKYFYTKRKEGIFMLDLHKLFVCHQLLDDKIIEDFNKLICGASTDKGKLVAEFIEQAEKLGLSGNIIKVYILYMLAHKNNCVSYAVESSGGQIGTSLYKAFCHDIEIISKLLVIKPSLVLDCELLDDYEPTVKNTSLSFISLAKNLVQAKNVEEKANVFIDYYRTYGSGDMADYRAFRWDSDEDELVGIKYFEAMRLDELIGYEYQKQQLKDNTLAFVEGKPANNVLLVGARGTGKSSGVKAVVNSFFDKGLRLVQITKEQLTALPIIMERLRTYSSKKFIIFLDDLSFEEFEVEYKYLKSAIEGGASAKPENVLIYATSNRRHLIKESYRNRGVDDDDMHRNDTLNETISLSDRFGLIIHYLSPNQEEYLAIVDGLLRQHGISMDKEELRVKAGAWAQEHSGRSGRIAQQFVTYYLGQVYNK